MYCSKCGTKNDDDAVVCVQCKSSLKRTNKIIVSPTRLPVQHNRKKIVLILIAILVVIGSVYEVKNIVNPGYKEVLQKWAKAISKQDVDLFLETRPDCFLKYYGRTKYRQLVSKSFRGSSEEKVKVHIIGVENLSSKELKDLKATYDYHGAKIIDAKRMRTELKWGDKISSENVVVVKIDKKWYIDMFAEEWEES